MRCKSWSWIFIPFLLAALRATGVAQIATTQIVDTIYHADGTTATGTALIAWPAFTTTFGDQVPAGNTSAVIATGGALNVQLVANSGAIPVGTYYTVTYHLDDNSITRQYWVVPQSATPMHIAAIESTVMPVSVAIQTATKSYVDTAIAAATTGHPLDSSPLVLKAGDTMTGPLVLPADPVSSLQASTKHYVDATVAAQVAASGGITGQTPNFIPLATSATASAISSHFFDDADYAGVTKPFNMGASAPNCNIASGPSFTRYKCFGVDSYDDGSTNTLPGGSRNLASFAVTHNAWGPGGSGSGGVGREGRASQVWADSNNGALVTPGTKTVHFSNTSGFGIGDYQGINYDFTCATGIAYDSDQGCQIYYRIWETAGPWAATITGGTNTEPAFTSSGGCTGLENQACAPIPGGWMRDLSVSKGSGLATGMSSSALGGVMTWASTVTTNFAPPASSAYGYKINANLAPDTTWDAPIAQTFTLQAGSGTFAAGDHACVIGTSFTEQNIISAVSGSSPTQTITIPLSMPQVSVAIFKGDCMIMTMDADAAAGVVYALPVVSIDGSSLIYPYEVFSSNRSQTEVPSDGVTWSKFDGGASSGIHLYAGARITTVGTSAPTAPFPFNAPYVTVSLTPNSAFSVGDSIDSPHYHAQKVDGTILTAGQTMASTSFGTLTGKDIHIAGQGANSNAAWMRGENDAPTTYYKPDGGPLNEPSFINQHGYFDNIFNAQYAPLTYGFRINAHQNGQASYSVWSDNTWGALSLDNTSTWHFSNSSVQLDQGSVTAVSGGMFAGYGMRTGVGDGASNGAGLEFSFAGRKSSTTSTWMTQCDLTANISKTDLCVTDQGTSRSSGVVTANRGLQVSALTTPVINGPVTVNGGTTAVMQTLHNTNPDDVCQFFSGTGAAIDAWGFCSLGSTVTGTGHKLGIINSTAGNWSWMQYLAGVTGPGYIENPDFMVNCWSSGVDVTVTACDTGLSRAAAATVNVGNGTAGDASGTLNAATVAGQLYKGPASAPSGACSAIGWAFSQDGHISYCNGATWTQKM